MPFDRARACARSTYSKSLDRSAEQPRRQQQPRVLGAKLQQPLLGVEAEVDGRRHLVSGHLCQLAVLRITVGGESDQVPVGGVRGVGGRGVGRLFKIGHELDQGGGVGEVAFALQHAEHLRAARKQIHAALLVHLQHALDPAGAADLPQAIIGQPDDPELRLALEAFADHRLVALLEDVQRHRFARQHDNPKREQREVLDARLRHGHAASVAGRRALSIRL